MPNDAKPDLGSLSFLIVEDDEFSRTVFINSLEKIGASKITTASNGVPGRSSVEAYKSAPVLASSHMR